MKERLGTLTLALLVALLFAATAQAQIGKHGQGDTTGACKMACKMMEGKSSMTGCKSDGASNNPIVDFNILP